MLPELLSGKKNSKKIKKKDLKIPNDILVPFGLIVQWLFVTSCQERPKYKD